MNGIRNPRPSPVEGLSVELVRLVLSALPNVASLRATVLSCPIFYSAFIGAEVAITTRVLLGQIDASVLPEAIAALESSRLRRNDGQELCDEGAVLAFMDQNLRHRPDVPRSWSLTEAFRVTQLHVPVSELAIRFVNEATDKSPLNRSRSISVTCQEVCRIERALYRFEVYCNIFRGSEMLFRSPVLPMRLRFYREQQRLFFTNFAPWENEQLGCIHDFLVSAVTPGQLLTFDDIVDHDVAWGASNVEYGEAEAPSIQRILFSGLENLHQIAEAETYEKRYGLIHHYRAGRGSPLSTELFLYHGLLGANEQTHIICLKWLMPQDDVLRTKQPCFSDSDPGPADAWRWAHQEESWAHWVYQANRRDLRRWGYVMWDRSRLKVIGLFREPWLDPSYSGGATLEQQDAARRRAGLQESWEKREWVWKRGGRGWWSADDESKVIYPEVVEEGCPRPVSEPGSPASFTSG
ncbi:hypothetical protein PG985_000810 [Apiospora marii]|uniref:F-box domain-containing protein n=1 Tax=Apiospora marii TaxID=335849 RepID=A0ABR1R4R3_9PEZI